MPVIRYLQKRFNVDYVDSITEAGPNLILTEAKKASSTQAIFERLKISVKNHHSVGVAIVGHHDCAGNPASKNEQILHLQKAIQSIRQQYENLPVIGLWVDKNWEVHEID
ncbi:MAG: hypothetical protein PVG96_05265 [Desulfobacterales bacterium]